MSTPIFRWNGEYWGFVLGDDLYDANGHQVGMIDKSNKVWLNNGKYLGDLIDENYILRSEHISEPVPKITRVATNSVTPLIPQVNRVGRVSRAGWIDPVS